MQIGFVRAALVLGLLAAVGPFAIDLYLPATPQIVQDLNTDDAGAHMTFTVYFIAFGFAQLIYGRLRTGSPQAADLPRARSLHCRIDNLCHGDGYCHADPWPVRAGTWRRRTDGDRACGGPGSSHGDPGHKTYGTGHARDQHFTSACTR